MLSDGNSGGLQEKTPIFLEFLQPAWKPFHQVELDISNLEPHFLRIYGGVREFLGIRALELQITLSEHKIHYYERKSDYESLSRFMSLWLNATNRLSVNYTVK